MEPESEDGNGERQKGWWEKAYYLLTFFLVGALSFGGGLLTKLWQEEGTLSVSVVSPSPPGAASAAVVSAASGPQAPATQPIKEIPAESTTSAQSCAYVGSKNSDKYHLPSCSYAKRILPENRVCFSTPEEAQQKGYSPGCLK